MNKMKTVDSPIYRYWEALYLSFYSFRVYLDVCHHWRGLGLKYLLFLVTIFALPFACFFILDFNQYFNTEIIEPVEKFPLLYIQNGNVSIDKPMPYLVKNKNGKVVSVIDNQLDILTADRQYPDAKIIVIKNHFFIKATWVHKYLNTTNYSSNQAYTQHEISERINEVFSGKRGVKQFGFYSIKYLILALSYPFLIGIFFGVYLTLILLVGTLGQVYAVAIFKVHLTYKTACRVLSVALTPHLFFSFLFMAFSWTSLPNQSLFILLLIPMYYTLGILSYKYAGQQLART